MIFDDFQKEVIKADGGHYLVLAPPGCGKTELLTHRIIRARVEGIPFSDMLCLTFTNRAARGMRDRIKEKIEEPCDDLFVGNIHRFCSKFLFENALVPATTGIIDELDQKDILDELGFTKHNINASFKEDMLSATDITRLAAIRYQKEMGHDASVLLPEPYIPYSKVRTESERIADGYYNYKKEHGLIDFDDILLLAYSAICKSKETSGGTAFRKYHWIQVDEVQDLNALQLAIIDLLTDDDNYTVMYLGDEQQAIYSFMGAKMQSLQTLATKAGEGHILRLYTNYRSPRYLVDAFNAYATNQLQMDASLLPRPLGNEEATKGMLNIFSYLFSDMMEQGLVDIVKRVTGRYPNERVGILTRTNNAANAISASLSANCIPHFKLSGQDVFKTDDFKTLLAHFSVVQSDTNYFDWARLLWKTKCTYSFKDARDIVSRLRNSAVSLVDLMDYPFGSCYVSDFLEVYNSKEIVIFDTETTGLDIQEDDIIQIAAVKVKGGKIVPGSEFNRIIRTSRTIPATLGDIENPLVGLYDEYESRGLLQDADKALMDFLTYVSDDDVLGHNVEFDYDIMTHNLYRRCGGIKIEDYIKRRWDSLRLIHLLQPRLRSYKLKDIISRFGMDGKNSHRADDDILATVEVVDYCAHLINKSLDARESLWQDINVRQAAGRIKDYHEFYRHTIRLLSSTNVDGTAQNGVAFLNEMRFIYDSFVGRKFIDKIPAFDYIVDFFSTTVFPQDGERTFKEQMSAHLNDLKTFSQSDLCDSGVIKENLYVMTIHKAKGLEFEHVILYDATEGTYPFFRSVRPEEVMEDARVFYVGLSRAKKRLSVMYPQYFRGYKKKLTPFMKCIEDRFLTYEKRDQ